MTPEERIQQVIGQQAFQIALLQSEVEKLRAELKKAEDERGTKLRKSSAG